METKDQFLRNHVSSLFSSLSSLRVQGLLAQTLPLKFPAHSHQPSDSVLIKTWKEDKIEPAWEAPYQVLLTAETAVRTAEKGWTHYTRVKGAPPPTLKGQWTITQHLDPLELTVKRL